MNDENLEWQPATIDEVKEIVEEDLKDCDAAQVAVYQKYAVEPFVAPIERYGKVESVVVVARKGNQVIYWEDTEYGFNVSPISEDGRILEHWCNQDELKYALNAWIEGRGLPGRFGPAQRLSSKTATAPDVSIFPAIFVLRLRSLCAGTLL